MRLMVLLLTVMALSGCERVVKNMYDQPRDKAYSANPFYADGASSRLPPAGTVAYSRGAAPDASSGRMGTAQIDRDDEAAGAQAMPYPIDKKLLVRGQERYAIYCLPCHSPSGDGDGRVVRLGFPAPPSYHIERLRNADDRHIYNVISDGYGVMAAYGDRIEPADRWAVVAFVRALQLSQYAKLSDLTPLARQQARQALETTASTESP